MVGTAETKEKTGALPRVQSFKGWVSLTGRWAVFFCVLTVSWIVAVCFADGRAFAQAPEPKNVLVLNSYHQTFPWTVLIVKGIQEAIAEAPIAIDPWFFYLDTTRYPAKEHLDQRLAVYREEFGKQSFDAVIVADNDAFDFALKHRDALFGDTPIVFCGINNFSSGMIEGQKNITGVAQYDDLEATLEIALRLHPKAIRVITTTAANTTGTILYNQAKDIFEKYRDRLQTDFWHGWPLEAVLAKLENTDENTIVIALGALVDNAGRTVPMNEVAARMAAKTRSPIYTTIDTGVGVGALGGSIASGVGQGRQALSLAVDILQGKAADDIPVITKGANPYKFDFEVMQRFGVDIDGLPAGSIVVNQPTTTFEQIRTYLLVAGVIIFVLGAFIAVLIMLIVKRKRMEEALIESQTRFRTFIDHSTTGIFLKDLEGRYLLANDAVAKRFGMKAEDMKGRNFRDVHSEEVAAFIAASDARVIARKTVDERENEIIYADGSRHTHLNVKFPVFDRQGNLVGIGGVSTDISDKKQAQDDMRALQSELAHVSRLSTMGEMAAGFAHELNQPLAAINNFAFGAIHRMRDGQFEQEQIVSALEQISGQARRAGEIIKRVRSFVSNKDAARANGDLPVIDLNRVIRAAIGLLASEKLKHGVELSVELPTSVPAVRADAIQIQQLVINLARNGMEAMRDAGSLKRELTIRTVMTGEDSIEIQVEDSGPGVPEDVLPRLFHPFFTTKATGMGLGLSICRSIAQNHKGDLTAENPMAGGALFRITLPAAESDIAAA
jgi:two-component system, cell cycle sensor histidine kinase and response regulator CckA